MATKPGHIVMGKEVPISFRQKFDKPKDLWYSLGQLFVALAGNNTVDELAELKREFPEAYEFAEEHL